MASGLQPASEAKFAIAESAWQEYLLTPDGSQTLNNFLADNPHWIDFTHPKAQKFMNLLYLPYFTDDTNFISSTELVSRLESLMEIGEIDRVKEVIGLGILNFSRLRLT